MMKSVLSSCLSSLALLGSASALDVPPGNHEDVVTSVAGRNTAAVLKLTGAATFGWKTDQLDGTIDLNGFNLIWETGGGNERTCNAAIIGAGSLTWIGGGANADTRAAPGWLGGTQANTFTGTLKLQQGTLVLNKPANVAAYGGKEFIIGEGSRNEAYLRWGNNHQLSDDARILLTGSHPVILRTNGFSDACGTLSLGSDAEIDFAGGPAELKFAASQAESWGAGRQLMVRAWNGNVLGGNAKRLIFGSDQTSLTAAQLAAIGFINPDGMPAGLYPAKMLPTGEVVPSLIAMAPAKLAFKVDAESDAARKTIYQSDGLKTLGKVMKDPTMPRRVGFFGDSITWLANGAGEPVETANPTNNFTANKQYYNQIGQIIAAGGGEIFNHALNGGGVREIEEGKEHTGDTVGKTFQPKFVELVEKNRLDMVVIYIGVNDAWWRETKPDVFASSLGKMVKAAQGRGCKVVIATPLCIGELPDGSNPKDSALELIVESARKVATETGATCADLRTGFLAWSRNNNREMKLDGSMISKKEGLLTNDGVHPTDQGATLIANLIADGMVKAAGIAPPAPVVAGPSPYDLIPLPRSIEPGQGTMSLVAGARIICMDDSLAPLATILSSEIETVAGLVIKPARPPAKPGDIILQMDSTLKGDAHTIAVSNSVLVKGGNYNAIAAGTSTVLQLLDSKGGKTTVPRLKISDDASFSYRSVLLDLGRKYHTISSMEQIIRMCRFYKIRFIHLHLTDDQLFMFPSKRFSNAGKTNIEFARFDPPSAPKIKPYTKEELVALDKFASDHGVALIPEIDLPGHSGRLIADEADTFAFPQNGSTVNIASPKTLKGVEILLNEVMDIFQSSPYVHLGVDEVSLNGLEAAPEYKGALAKDPTLTGPHDLYCKFILFMNSVVTKRGKKSIVWEEGWSPTGPYPLPKDVTVMVWSQGRNPIEIAKSGYQIINTTWTPLYLVRDNKKTPKFLFDWNPTLFGREGSEEYVSLGDSSKLLGCQLSSWENAEATEIQSMRERAAIVAERTWNADAAGTYVDFQKRWRRTDAILDCLVHPVKMETEGDFTTDEHTFSGSLTVTLTSRLPGHTVRYALDNSLSGSGWKPYDKPLVIDKPVYLRAGVFDRQGKQSGGLLGAWFKPLGAAAAR